MKGLPPLVVLVLCALVAISPPASAATRTGKVAKVVDGDTIRVVIKRKTVKVDLLGISAANPCIAGDAAAKLRSLLRKGAKVRVVSDGSRKGAYVFKGTKMVNRELLVAGLATVSGSGLRQGAVLLAAQEIAKAAGRGVWNAACTSPPGPNPSPSPSASPTPGPSATPTPTPGPVDSAENRAEFDKVLRGFRFTVHDSQSGSFGYTQDRVFHWCADGHYTYERTLVTSGAGNEYEREDGTWKVSNVTVREGQRIEGNVDVTSGPEGTTPTQGFIYGGLTSDGTGFIRVSGTNGENRLASRVADNFC
jgi:endonuclease YncB( thermonuclease family)